MANKYKYNPLLKTGLDIAGSGKNEAAQVEIKPTDVILDVEALPTGEAINPKCFYRMTETDPVSMTKLFHYENEEWVSLSRIYLSQENYNKLSEAQKNDGTLYVVEDGGDDQAPYYKKDEVYTKEEVDELFENLKQQDKTTEDMFNEVFNPTQNGEEG